MQYCATKDSQKSISRNKRCNSPNLRIDGKGSMTRPRTHYNTFSFTESPSRKSLPSESSGKEVDSSAFNRDENSSSRRGENVGFVKQKYWNVIREKSPKSIKSRQPEKSSVSREFREINMNDCISVTDFEGSLARQFGDIFQSKGKPDMLEQLSKNEHQNSKKSRFHKYRNEEEARCRFKAKLLRVPNISKYMGLNEISDLFDKCMTSEIPEAQWQLNVVELVRKRLNR